MIIDSVKNKVFAILNKQNNGVISPEQFNDFAEQAQLEIFNSYLKSYKDLVIGEKRGQTATDYADFTEQKKQTIDYFSKIEYLTYSNGFFNLPDEWYYTNIVQYVKSEKDIRKVDIIDQSKIPFFKENSKASPTTLYPVGYQVDNKLKILPTMITGNIQVSYIRYPYKPKWTYTLVNGNPLFNPTANDFQDFELQANDVPRLVYKILSLAGVNIRELQVVDFAINKDVYIKNNDEA